MRNLTKMYASSIIALVLAASLFGQTGHRTAAAQGNRPSIEIIVVPPWDPGGPDKLGTIAGIVSGATGDCRVVIFAHGDVWYVQPFTASPFTSIDSGGKWRTDTHLGTEYAALLVTSAYRPPNSTIELPRQGGEILAITRVSGKRQ
jgi:hypothetical protein